MDRRTKKERSEFLLIILTFLFPYYVPTFFAHSITFTCFHDTWEKQVHGEYEYLFKCIFVLNQPAVGCISLRVEIIRGHLGASVL